MRESVQFSLDRETPPLFTLTCTTTGGPASTVQWTRNGVALTNGGRYSLSQTIVNLQTATYENNLTVSGKYLGVYSIFVSNSRTPQPVTSQYNVTGIYCSYNSKMFSSTIIITRTSLKVKGGM